MASIGYRMSEEPILHLIFIRNFHFSNKNRIFDRNIVNFSCILSIGGVYVGEQDIYCSPTTKSILEVESK